MDQFSLGSQLRSLRYPLPSGATDCHIHVFGPASAYPYPDERDFTPGDAMPSQIRALHDAIGISRAVLVQASVYGGDNARHLSAAREIGVQSRVIVSIDSGSSDEKIDHMHAAGARGVRLMVAKHGWPEQDALLCMAERIAGRGWHLQIFARPDQLTELEARLPDLACPVVIDHLGMINPAGGLEQSPVGALLRMLETGRCWVKISGYYRLSQGDEPYEDFASLVATLAAAAPHRLLWGSDWPHPAFAGPVPDLAGLIDPLFDWIPDEDTRRLIFVENPACLFGFDADAPAVAGAVEERTSWNR